jgi:hypothetical protein
MKPYLLTLCALWAATSFAIANTLDELVAYEQARVDNEAVLVFGGKVGKLDAVFFIEWDEYPGNTLDGRYYYPSRGRDRMYRLAGKLPKPDVLLLEEFTPKAGGSETPSATCRLTKRVSGDRIIWEGTMRNADGRELPMSFSRKN